jgi:hypothetical protein
VNHNVNPSGDRMHVQCSICVTDDQSRTRGLDHRVQGKEGNASQTRLFIPTRLYFNYPNLVFLAILTFHLTPLYIFSTHLYTPGVVYFLSVVYQYNFHSRSTLSIIACSCLSHTVSHININPSHRSYPSSYTYRSGTDTFLS